MFGILGRAQEDSHRRVIAFSHFVFSEIIEIKIKLAHVVIIEFFGFQLNENMAFQQAVVKDKINIKMLMIHGDPSLPGLKTKSFTEFQQKFPEMIDQGAFKILFQQDIAG